MRLFPGFIPDKDGYAPPPTILIFTDHGRRTRFENLELIRWRTRRRITSFHGSLGLLQARKHCGSKLVHQPLLHLLAVFPPVLEPQRDDRAGEQGQEKSGLEKIEQRIDNGSTC